MNAPLRHLVLVLGDQLNDDASALADFDPTQDAVWMAEVMEESTHVRSSKARTAVFLSAMRHFATRLRAKGWTVHYSELDDPLNSGSLAGELTRTLAAHPAQALVMTAPGDWRVLQALRGVAKAQGLMLDIRDDT
ncbi:MAG: cryptochrome/photolyase family protein, partial [Hydrogenophaga sp.]|nr:cryptochrome/photolyase family protein [Hydrogenophaga sp.]